MTDWFQTRSGAAFEPTGDREYRAFDLVWALSMLCRFGGHCSRFYSVGEHSIRVYRIVREMTDDPVVQLQALLHDGDESWFNDIVRPVKYLPEMMPYRIVTSTVMAELLEDFGLPMMSGDEKKLIKTADFQALATERVYLMRPMSAQWDATREWGELPPPRKLPWWDRMGWPPIVVRQVFWYRLLSLCREIGLTAENAPALKWVKVPWWCPWLKLEG